jgi:hypothetical protein
MKVTREQLKETESELVETVENLKTVKGALNEEILVRDAYQGSEAKLDGVATGLRDVAKDSVSDVEGLFDKLGESTRTTAPSVLIHLQNENQVSLPRTPKRSSPTAKQYLPKPSLFLGNWKTS